MADVFTQVVLYEGLDRASGPRVSTGSFQIRMDNGGLFTIFAKGDVEPDTGHYEMILHNARVTSLTENEVEVVGFSRSQLVVNTFAAATLILTRPGTGWDGKEPTS